MRFALFLAVFLASPAIAEPVNLVCQPSDGRYTWSARVQFDLDEWFFSWGGTEWELIGGDDRAVVARTVHESNWPSSVLIDRETGRFWRTNVGRFCQDESCSSSRLGAFVDEGTCTVPF